MVDRDEMIKKMLQKKMDKSVNKVAELTRENKVVTEVSPNMYKITDPDVSREVAKGEAYINSLPNDVKLSIKYYTGFGYNGINSSLRYKSKEKQNNIKNLDKAILFAPPLEFPITVYRGVTGFDQIRDDDGYSSCSMNKNVSLGFGGGKCFTIKIPIGSRILFVKPISSVPYEDEIIIGRGGTFEQIDGENAIYTAQLNDE